MVSSRPQIASQRLHTPRVVRGPDGTRPSCHGSRGGPGYPAVRPVTGTASRGTGMGTVTPTIDRDTWRLRVFGTGLSEPRAEGDALSLSYADLRRLPVIRLTASHECTGNGRSFFTSQQGTPASGTAWKLGAVGAWELGWGETIARRDEVELTGRSWSGAAAVDRVDVSVDGGS